jgi:hypothetical protein
MAFKLTRSEESRLELLRDKLADARLTLEAVFNAQSAVIEDAYAEINAALAPYNEIVEEARGFVEDIASEREGEWDDKSERWQESDRGQAARDWFEQWRSAAECEIETIDDLEPTVPEFNPVDVSDLLENLPVEMEP